MADTTTISTQGHFGTVSDRIVAIATQGHYLALVVPSATALIADKRVSEFAGDMRIMKAHADRRVSKLIRG
jgi:hypothetical protein